MSYGISALSWVPVREKHCLHPPRVKSLFPLALWNSGTQAPLAFKAKYSGALPLLRSMMWGSEEDFRNTTFSILWVAHSDGMGLDYVVTAILPPSCSFLLAVSSLHL